MSERNERTDLRFEDVTVRYGRTTAVDGVSLTVPEGEVVGLVGESGSGKTTLARAAVGLAPLTRGRITLGGDPVPTRGRPRPLQMVFQDPYSSLDPRMTVGRGVAEAIPPAARAPSGEPRSSGCSIWSISTRTAPTPSRRGCPAASGSGSRWRGRSRHAPA